MLEEDLDKLEMVNTVMIARKGKNKSQLIGNSNEKLFYLPYVGFYGIRTNNFRVNNFFHYYFLFYFIIEVLFELIDFLINFCNYLFRDFFPR